MISSSEIVDGVIVCVDGREYEIFPIGIESEDVKKDFNHRHISSNIKECDRFSLKSNGNNQPERNIDYVKLGNSLVKPSQNEAIKQLWNVRTPSKSVDIYVSTNGGNKLNELSFAINDKGQFEFTSKSNFLDINFISSTDQTPQNISAPIKTTTGINVDVDRGTTSDRGDITADNKTGEMKIDPPKADTEHSPLDGTSQDKPKGETEVTNINADETKTTDTISNVDKDPGAVILAQNTTPSAPESEPTSSLPATVPRAGSVIGPGHEFSKTDYDTNPTKSLIGLTRPVTTDVSNKKQYHMNVGNGGRVPLYLDKIENWDTRISSTFKDNGENFSIDSDELTIGDVFCGVLKVAPLKGEVKRSVRLEYIDDKKKLTIESVMKDDRKISKIFELLPDGSVNYEKNNMLWKSAVTISKNTNSVLSDLGDISSSSALSHVDNNDNVAQGKDENIDLLDPDVLSVKEREIDILDTGTLSKTFKIKNFGNIYCYYTLEPNASVIKMGQDVLHERIMAKEIHICIKSTIGVKLVRLALLSTEGNRWKVLYYIKKSNQRGFVQKIEEIPPEPSFAHISYSSKYLDASKLPTSIELVDAPILDNVWDLWPGSVLNLDKFPIPLGMAQKKNSSDNKNVSFYYESLDEFRTKSIKIIRFDSFEHSITGNFKLYHVEVLFSSVPRSIILFKTDGLSTAFEVYRENDKNGFMLVRDAYKLDEFIIDHPLMADHSYHYGRPKGKVLDVLNNTSIGAESLDGFYTFKKIDRKIIYLFKNDGPEIKIRFGPNEMALHPNLRNKRVMVLPSLTAGGDTTVTYQYIKGNRSTILTYQFYSRADEQIFNQVKPREPIGYTVTNSVGAHGHMNSRVKYSYNMAYSFPNNASFFNPMSKLLYRVDLNLNASKLPEHVSRVNNADGGRESHGTFKSSSNDFVIGKFIAGNIHVSVKPGESSKRIDYKIKDGIKEFNVVSIVDWNVVQQKFKETAKDSGVFIRA